MISKQVVAGNGVDACGRNSSGQFQDTIPAFAWRY